MVKERSNTILGMNKMKNDQKVVLKSFRRDRNKKNKIDDGTEPLLSTSASNNMQEMKEENCPTTSRNVSPNLKELYSRFHAHLMSSDSSNSKTNSTETKQSKGRPKSLTWKLDHVAIDDTDATNENSTNTDDEMPSSDDSNDDYRTVRRRGVSLPTANATQKKSPVLRESNKILLKPLLYTENTTKQTSDASNLDFPSEPLITHTFNYPYGKVLNCQSFCEFDKQPAKKTIRRASMETSTIYSEKKGSKNISFYKTTKQGDDDKVVSNNISVISSPGIDSDFQDVYEAITKSRNLANATSRTVEYFTKEDSKENGFGARTESISLSDEMSQRSTGQSVCGNQALLNTIDPEVDDYNSNNCDKENCYEVKVQLDFSETAADDVQHEETSTVIKKKDRIDDSVQVGYVSQRIAQMEEKVGGKKSLPKARNVHGVDQNPISVKVLLSRLENNKEHTISVVNDVQSNANVRQIPSKKQNAPPTFQQTEQEKFCAVEVQPESSNDYNISQMTVPNQLTVPLPYNKRINEFKKENERLLEENSRQRAQIIQLERELDMVNDKVSKLHAEQFAQKRESLEIKARMELKIKELAGCINAMNIQRLAAKQ